MKDNHESNFILLNLLYFWSMSIRQDKIANEIQRELSIFFQKESATIGKGAMVTVTTVRISPDMTSAKVYVSIFAGPPPAEVLANINTNMGKIKGFIGKQLSGMRRTPALTFYIDDSLDYAEKIDDLLKK